MNECEKYREMIGPMLDGELDHAESERLIRHMSSCAECREMYDLLSSVTGSPAWELPEAPAGLHGHIMAGVKSAAAADKKRTRLRRLRPLAAAAACLVVIVGVILGVPRFSGREGAGSSAPFFNMQVGANSNNAAPAGTAAGAGANDAAMDQSAPASAESSASGRADDVPADGAFDNGAESGRTDDAQSAGAAAPADPVPEPEAEPEEVDEPEEPFPNIDIAESIITVESRGGTATEKLGREDTLMWLRAVIEGRFDGISAAKVEIYRLEGTDYEVYLYHDGSQLMGSLSEELTGGVKLNKLADFAVFQELADGVK